MLEKTILTRSKANLGFLNLEKAFDRIGNMYNDNIYYVISRSRKSDTFNIKESLRQGGVLSPALFNVFIDGILKECKQKLIKLATKRKTS